jgi:hypothetical protein
MPQMVRRPVIDRTIGQGRASRQGKTHPLLPICPTRGLETVPIIAPSWLMKIGRFRDIWTGIFFDPIR